MKKSLLALLLLISALGLTSCWKDDNGLDKDYISVYDGIVLYVGATNTNEVALDAVSIAMRLGVLLNEIEEHNSDPINADNQVVIPTSADGDVPKWSRLGKFNYGGFSYYPSEILLGKFSSEGEPMSDDNQDGEVKIWRDGEGSTTYYIKYGVTYDGDDIHTQAWFDNLYRRGTFIIETQGVMLDKSDISTAWTVSADGGDILYSTASDGVATSNYVNHNTNATIYRAVIDTDDQTEGFSYYITGASPCIFDSSTHVDGNWDMSGTLELVDFDFATDSFNLEDTEELRYELSINASGQPIAVPSMTFKTTSPIEYRPMNTGFYNYNSAIEIKLTSASSDYADDKVYVEIDNDGYWTVEYNDTIYRDSE